MLRNTPGILLLSSLLTCSSQLYAAKHEHDEHEEHQAHVHGEAKLLIALEGNTLEIEFLSPAMNIVGFEHKPANDSQKHAVETALATMKQADKLFTLPDAAGCKSESTEVESPLAGHDDHDHAKEEHKDEHEEEHSDFTAHYHFKCADPSSLKQIDINIFKLFPGTDEIEVQSISKQGQQKLDLTPGKNKLEL